MLLDCSVELFILLLCVWWDWLDKKASDVRKGFYPGSLSCGLVIRVLELSGNLAKSHDFFQNLRSGPSELVRRMFSSVACRNCHTLHRPWVAKHLCVPTLLFSLEPPLVSIMTSTGSLEGSSIHYGASHSVISNKGTQVLHKGEELNNNQAVKAMHWDFFSALCFFQVKKKKRLSLLHFIFLPWIIWVWISFWPLISCVTLSVLPNLAVLQFLYV